MAASILGAGGPPGVAQPYAYPQVIVTWYDGYTGAPVYSESVSALDHEAPPDDDFMEDAPAEPARPGGTSVD